MVDGVAMQKRKVRKKQSPPVSTATSKTHLKQRAFQREVNSRLNVHFLILALIMALGCLFCLYLMLSSKQEKMHSVRAVAAAHSASRIISSNKPFLIYGTAWKKDDTAKYVSQAIHSGFRFIDTACQPKHYNEAGVGEGWTEAAEDLGLQRSDLFLQTKFTSFGGQDPNNVPYNHDDPIEEQVKQSLQVSLKNLKTTYLDSLVLHSPYPKMEDTLKVWRVFESFVDEGKVLRLGISNCYDYQKFTTLYQEARIKPWAVQNRFYKESGFDTELRAFCKEKHIRYQSFWTLTANRNALASEAVKEAAARVNLTPQTYMFAFLLSQGYFAPLSGTTSRAHMMDDVAVMERIQKGEAIFRNSEELQQMAKALGMPKL